MYCKLSNRLSIRFYCIVCFLAQLAKVLEKYVQRSMLVPLSMWTLGTSKPRDEAAGLAVPFHQCSFIAKSTERGGGRARTQALATAKPSTTELFHL